MSFLRGAAVTVALLSLIVLAAATVWNASESHYRACVESRLSEGYGVARGVPGRIVLPGQTPTLTGLQPVSVEGCSRLPL
jgi:hypothetical protein